MEISTSSSKERRAATDATARKTKRLPCLTRLKMFHNLDQLRLQLERENLHGVNAKTCLQALRTQFKEFLAQKEPENNDAFSKPESETHMQRQEEKVNMREAVDAGLVVTESSGTNPDKQNTSSIQGVIPHKLWMQYQTSKLTKKHLLSHSHYLPKVIESALQHSSGECPDYQGIVITNRMVISHSPKDPNNNPVEPKNHTHKPGKQIGIGQRFSLNKSSVVHEKPHTPRSCLRWKPTGRIFKTVSLRWIPIGKMFTDSTTKVNCEPPNGSNDDITNPYKCNQTLYFGAGTSNSSADTMAEENIPAPEPTR
ncbi:hypothetical protein Tco_1146416 [Tanacetum coccineum]